MKARVRLLGSSFRASGSTSSVMTPASSSGPMRGRSRSRSPSGGILMPSMGGWAGLSLFLPIRKRAPT